MTQRPTADFNIDPNITSGTDLANILNRFQDAIDSGNSGPSRPAYLDAGGLWVQTGNPMRLFFYDGTSDRELFNTNDGVIGIDDGTEAGQVTTWNGSAWTPDSALIFDISRNATFSGDVKLKDDNAVGLDLLGTVTSVPTAQNHGYIATAGAGAGGANGDLLIAPRTSAATSIRFITGVTPTERLAIDHTGDAKFSGNVGIGMDPLRSTAKEQLEVWQSRFDAQIEADPKADKKALTLEITDNAFDALPTEAELAEWMEGRAAGDALQVAGDGSFTGTVNANQITARSLYRLSAGGFRFTTSGHIVPVNASGSDENNLIDIGENSFRFADGYFAGTVNANEFVDANGPIISAFTMVEAFRKIKSAVADETTVEGIKESLTNVLGGLIEEFESIGTQES
jgi:hypothetical protein